MACVSSFFRFLMCMEIVDRNPCDRPERPRTSRSPPRGLSADEIRRLLAIIPDTRVGLGHSTVSLTLDVYSHAIPSMEEEAASRIAALITG